MYCVPSLEKLSDVGVVVELDENVKGREMEGPGG